MTHKLQAKL